MKRRRSKHNLSIQLFTSALIACLFLYIILVIVCSIIVAGNAKDNVVAEKVQEIEIIEEVVDTTYKVTEEEYEILVKLVYCEANTESFECQVAVAYTILNRVNSERFPGTIYEVIMQKNQFQPMRNGAYEKASPTISNYAAVDYTLKTYSIEPIHPSNVVYFWAKSQVNKGSWYRFMQDNNLYKQYSNTIFYYE